MSDVLRMQLDIQNNLEKDLEKSTKKMKGFNSLIEDAGDKFVNMGKTITKSVGGALKAVGRIISTIIPGFAALFSVATILDAVRGVLEMNKSLTQLSHRMGHGAQGARVLQQTVFEVNAELGIGVDKTQELVTVLTTMRVPLDMMKDMTRTVGLFAELTGISADRAAELGGNLVTIGRMGQEAVDGIMASMVGVQRAIGLTESEMNSLSDTIVGSTQMLNQMGKSAGDIEKYNRGVVKLAAAFASVGVEAGKVLSIMDDLLDPSEVEKHAFLLSQLGVSLGDAFEGNIDPAQLVSGFKDLGQTLQGMTGPAAAAMAEQLNMSVRDLRQMGELGEDELAKVAEAMADGASGADAMAAAFNEEATGLQNFERTMEKIKGFIGETAVKFMPAIEKLFEWVSEHAETFMGYVSKGIEWFMKLPNMIKMAIPLLIGGIILFFKLMRRRFATTATEAGKSLETGVTEGITQGSRKGALAMKKEFASAKEIDLRVRTEQGAGFKSMIGDAELLETRAQGMEGFFGNVMRKTAGMHRNLAYSTKPIALLESKSKAMAETHSQTYELAKNQTSQIKAAFELRERGYADEQVRLANRIKYLQDHGDTESSQVKHLQKLHDELNKKKLSADSRLADATQASIRREQRAKKAMSNDMLLDLALEKKARQDNLESSIAGISKRHKASQKETDALNLAMKDLQFRSEDMNLLDFQKATKEINASLLEQEDIRSQLESQQKQEENRVENLKTEYGEIGTILREDRGISEISEAAKSLSEEGGHFSKFITQGARNLRLSVTQTAANFAEGARNAAGAFADRFRKENIGATLRGGVRKGARAVGRGAVGAARGAAGAAGGLLKMLGPIGLIAGLLQNMEPIQELMAKVMERVRGALGKVAEALMPLFEAIMDSLFPVIDDLIATLLPIAMDLIEVLEPVIDILIKALMPVLTMMIDLVGKLVKLLLPPLLRILGFLLTAIGTFISAVGRIVPGLKDVGDQIQEAGRSMSSAANDLATQIREDARNRERLERERQMFDQTAQNIQTTLANNGIHVTEEQIFTGELNNKELAAVEEALAENVSTMRQAYLEEEIGDIENTITDFARNISREMGNVRTLDQEALGSQMQNYFRNNQDEINRITEATGISQEQLMENLTRSQSMHGMEQFQLAGQRDIRRSLGVGSDGVFANIFGGRLNQDAAGGIQAHAGAAADRRTGGMLTLEEFRARNRENLAELELLNGTVTDLPDDIAGAQEQNEIRRTWEPAQLRALKDGIEQEQAMTEVLSGTANYEERIAHNSDRQVELLEAEVTELRRQNELLEHQTRQEEEHHEEEVAVVRRQQREAGNFGGYSTSLR